MPMSGFIDKVRSDVFLTYVFLVAGVLVTAGGALLFTRLVLRREVDKVWTIYRSWLFMSPLVLGSVCAGRPAAIVFLTAIALLGFKEFARATGLYRDWWMTSSGYLGILAVGASSLMQDPFLGKPGWFGLFRAIPVYVVALLLVIPVVRNRVRGQVQTASLAIVGFIYIGWMFGHLAFLANVRGWIGYMLFLVFAVSISDVSAFLFGRTFGRRPFRSEISPNKTWEGAIGAFAVSMSLPWLLNFSFPSEFGMRQKILAGLIVGLGGQVGDLCISFIKRDVGIKDMGASIPGHGGVLDRVDSLIYTSPLFLHMINYYYGV